MGIKFWVGSLPRKRWKFHLQILTCLFLTHSISVRAPNWNINLIGNWCEFHSVLGYQPRSTMQTNKMQNYRNCPSESLSHHTIHIKIFALTCQMINTTSLGIEPDIPAEKSAAITKSSAS